MPSQNRVGLVLAPHIYKWLSEEAKGQGRPIANLAAFLLTRAVEQEIERKLRGNEKEKTSESQ
jgi:CopG-like RHH_1 or ribbon-helix-helix domain, RHH_5